MSNAIKPNSDNDWIQKAAELSHVGYWKYNVLTQQVFWSDRVYEIHGVEKTKYMPAFDSAVNFYHPEDRSTVISVLQECLKKRVVCSTKARIVTPDGLIKFIEVHSNVAINDNTKEITELYGTFYDLTDYVKQNDKLKEINRRYELATKNNNNLVWDWCIKNKLLYLSADFGKKFTFNEKLTLPLLLKYIHKQDVKFFKEQILQLTDLLKNLNFEIRILNKWKEYRWVDIKINIEKSRDNKLKYLSGTIEDITESKRINGLLLRNEQYIKAYIDNSLIGRAILSINGDWHRVNEALCDLLGYKESELLKLTFQDITHPEDIDNLADLKNKLIREENKAIQIEKRYVKKNGNIIYTLLNVSLVRDEYNKPLYFLSQIQDITHIIADKKEIIKNERRLELALSSADTGIWDIDLVSNSLYISNKWKGILGYQDNYIELTKRAWRKIVHHEDLSRLYSHINKHIKNKKSNISIEVRLRDKARNSRWVLITGQIAERSASGRVKRIVGSLWDLNAKTRTYRILEKICAISANSKLTLKDKFSDLIKEISTYLELDSGFIFKEKKKHKIIKYRYHSGKVKLSDYKKYAICLNENNYQNGIAIDFRIYENNENKVIFNNVIAAKIEINNRSYGCIIFFGHNNRVKFSDEEIAIVKLFSEWISAQISSHNYLDALVQSEIKLESSVEKLTESNKELGRFAYVASHDLQEPLRTVLSLTEILKNKYTNQLDDKANKYLDFMVDAATNMKTLISDLLEYSQIDNRANLISEQVDLNNVLQHVLNNLKESARLNNAEIIFDQLPVIRGNFPATLSLMQNLLSNALKYSQNRDTPIIKINSIEQEHDYKISVEDNGIGVEAEYFKQIFEPFTRLEAKEEYAGTGIGLAICKKIIQQLSGEIWLESELGIGSVFYFTIPKI